MQIVRGHVRYAEAFMVIYALMATSFLIVPLTQRDFPSIMWLPYDPCASNFYYFLTYTWQLCCTATISITVISTIVYVYTVLICLRFNYISLGERLQRIGYRQHSKVDVCGDLIDLIKLHLKMNQ